MNDLSPHLRTIPATARQVRILDRPDAVIVWFQVAGQTKLRVILGNDGGASSVTLDQVEAAEVHPTDWEGPALQVAPGFVIKVPGAGTREAVLDKIQRFAQRSDVENLV